MRSISRITGASINTLTKTLEDAGKAFAVCHDATVRNVKTTRAQCFEIWSFCYPKIKNVATAKAASGLPVSGGRVIAERQVCGLVICRSYRSVGSPERQITFIRIKGGALAARAPRRP